MVWRGNRTLYKRLLFKSILLGLFSLLQGLCVFLYLTSERQHVEESVAQSLKNTAALQARNFGLLENLIAQQLQSIGDIYVNDGKVSAERLAREIQAEHLDAVLVLDATGKIVHQASLFIPESFLSPETLRTQSFAENPKYQRLRKQDVQADTDFAQRPRSEQLAGGGFVFYRALRNEDGSFAGSVLGLLSNRTLDNMFSADKRSGVGLGFEGVAAIYDPVSQQLLYRSLISRARPGDEFVPQKLTDTVYDVSVKTYISPFDGLPRLAAFQAISHGRWQLLVGMSENEYLKNWYFHVGVASMTLLCLLILQWWLLHVTHRMQLQKDEMAFDSLHDPLTGLANRRSFDVWVTDATSRAKRYMQPLALLALDLDHFKRINDTHGHDVGDLVLMRVAEVLKTTLREGDLAARFGGEEFVVALPQTPVEGAALVAEKLRVAIQEAEIHTHGETLHCTASIGVSMVTGQAVELALKHADKALYRAKEAGRNCVIVPGGSKTDFKEEAEPAEQATPVA